MAVTKRKSLFLILFLLLCRMGFSQKILFEAFPETYVVYRATEKLVMDGRLDEANWQNIPWTRDFVDIEGSSKPDPFLRTRMKMLWDDDYFYVAAELEETDIWATLSEPESVIFHENNFEIFIDPNGETHNYFELEINALGTIWDLMLPKPYRNGGKPINAWDIRGFLYGIHLRGTLNDPSDRDTLWTIEMALPWKILTEVKHKKKPPLPGEQWRVNFSRVQWLIESVDEKYRKVCDPETGLPYPEHNWVWSPQWTVDMHRPEFWGFVQFSGLKAGESKESFQLDPDEYLKFVLRELYYKQHNFFLDHHRFAKSLKELQPEDPEFFKTYPVIFDACNSRFRLSIPSEKGRGKWHISEDSRIWRTTSRFEERSMFY